MWARLFLLALAWMGIITAYLNREGDAKLTIVRLGYSAISTQLQNSSTSKTMTYTYFSKLEDREAAVRKLEDIANANLQNLLRLLRYNVANDISFYRASSRLIPLAGHPDLQDWNYLRPLKRSFQDIRDFLGSHPRFRMDFHADHFVLINSPNETVLTNAIYTLKMHYRLLKGLGIKPDHRCILHVGGGYGDVEKALEQFVSNWAEVPHNLQQMIILENDDKTFSAAETLYLCEKLNIPMVFDYHHHLANPKDVSWEDEWDRIVKTWDHSSLPVKMHISSPRDELHFRAHADYVDVNMFMGFLTAVKGSVPSIDCMIEAKQKDGALFRLMDELKSYPEIEQINGGEFYIK